MLLICAIFSHLASCFNDNHNNDSLYKDNAVLGRADGFADGERGYNG